MNIVPSVLVERTGRLQIEAPDECRCQLETLRDAYLDTSYLATAVTLTRLDDVFVSTPRGVCVTADGILIDETARVAREIDSSLADVPFISVSDNAFTPGRCAVVSDPLLHCSHGAAGAYGHFLFDVLPIVALFQESILAGRLKGLVPPFPRWGFRSQCRKRARITNCSRRDGICNPGTRQYVFL